MTAVYGGNVNIIKVERMTAWRSYLLNQKKNDDSTRNKNIFFLKWVRMMQICGNLLKLGGFLHLKLHIKQQKHLCYCVFGF